MSVSFRAYYEYSSLAEAAYIEWNKLGNRLVDVDGVKEALTSVRPETLTG